MGKARAAGAAVLVVTALAGALWLLAPEAGALPRWWPRQVGGVKAAVASMTTLLLALGWWWRRQGRDPARPLRDALLGLLGLLGVLCWTNLGQWNYPGFGHPSDTFHYYLGAKYFPELGYTGLYACVAVADAQAGLAEPRPLRDLADNVLTTSAAVLAAPERCTDRFDADRWAAFRHDVDFLRSRSPPERWLRFQQDHGYNATPAWGLLGGALARTGPASEAQLFWLRALDPLLLLLMGAGIAWAFGWRIACVAAVFFGTNYAAPYGWTGGSILRQDWLVASVLGLCALRRQHFAAGGALLALATLLRLFPGLVVAGVALAALGRMWRERRFAPTRAEWAFAAGGLATVALVVPLTLWSGGARAWSEFAANSATHLSTPLANHAGLRTVLSYDPATRTELARDASLEDPMQPWKEGRTRRFAQYAWLHGALVLLFAARVAAAGAGQPLWVGGVLGVALVPVAAELTAYYWSLLLALAFASERHPVLAPGVAGLAASGWAVASLWHWTDQIHVWLSVLTIAFCVFVVRLVATGAREPAQA
ncbi:MAG: hypothetical protein ACQGVC_07030 [Myxococcota bacterium]